MWSFFRVWSIFAVVCLLGARLSLGQISVRLPTVQATVNTSGVVPVEVGDLTGQSVTAFQFIVTYDPTIIEITGVSGDGTLSDGKLLLENTSVPGQISVSSASDFAFEGMGTLVNLEVNYLTEGTTALAFESFMFNEGSPASTPSNGSLTVVAGNVPTTIDVSLPASLNGRVGQPVTIPVRVGDVTGESIISYQFTFTFDPGKLEVSGINVNGTLSEGAAPVTNLISPGAYNVTWIHTNALAGSGVLIEITVVPLSEGNASVDLESFMFNSGTPAAEVTGGVLNIAGNEGESISITLPETSGTVSQPLLIPVLAGSVTGKSINAIEFTVSYDPEILRVDDIAQAGTLTSGETAILNTSTPGSLQISWASVTPLDGSGVLLHIQATPLKVGTSALAFDSFRFNEGSPAATLSSGSVTVVEGNDGARISLPKGLEGARGSQISIPVFTEDLTGKNVTSFAFTLAFDDAVLDIEALDLEGTLLEGGNVLLDNGTSGQIIVSYSASEDIAGFGVLLNLVATLKNPGTSDLSFVSFQLDNNTVPLSTVSGTVTVDGQAAFLQVVHNSPDVTLVDLYINDEKQLDGIAYTEATSFIDVNATAATIDIVADEDADNTSPLVTTTVTLENGKDYVAVLNGLLSGEGNTAVGLVVQESQRQAANENSLGLVFFQGSPDAPPVNAYLVEGSANNRVFTIAEGISFGQGRLTQEFLPGIYNIELTHENGSRIGIYRADLSRTGGASLLFMAQGFVQPSASQPGLSMTAYAPNGQAISLPSAQPVNNEQVELYPEGFQLRENYPNPFSRHTAIRFDLPESAFVKIQVFDMTGRNVMSLPGRLYTAGKDHEFQIQSSGLASGAYLYRLIAEGARQVYTQSRKMTVVN